MAKLQATYNAIIHSRDEAKEQLAKEISDQRLTEWELDHQKSRIKDYRGQVDRIQTEIAVMKSHMPMISESFFFFFFTNCLCYQGINAELL